MKRSFLSDGKAGRLRDRCLTFFFLVFILSIGLHAQAADNKYGADSITLGPRLYLPETSFDFGFTPPFSTVNHVFWIYSAGDDTLRIKKIVPG